MLTDINAIKARAHLADASDSLLLAAHSPFDKNRRFDSAVEDLREAMGLLGFDITERLTPQQAADRALARRRSEDRADPRQVAADDRGDIVGTR